MSEQGVTNAIEVRVEKMTQLFDTLDPFPFRERDLDQHAEEYADRHGGAVNMCPGRTRYHHRSWQR
jgi:hypothetical protein